MSELGTNSVSLAEVIAYLKQTRRTGRLVVRAPTMAAVTQLLFEEGILVDARNERDQGDDLVYRLLAIPEATFGFERLGREHLPAAETRNIDQLQSVLMLAAIGALSVEEEFVPRPQPQVRAEPPPPPPPPAPEEVPERIHSFYRRNSIPLPPGKPMALDTALLRGDLPQLLDSLAEQQLSGDLVVYSEAEEGLLLLYRGQVIDAFWSEVRGRATLEDAFAVERMAEDMGAAPRFTVRMYVLSGDLVWAYSSIAYGSERRSETSLSGVDLSLLLERLSMRQHTGCVKTVAGHQAAYIFMCRGVVLGDFEALPDSLAESPGRSLVLVQEPGSLVDIYTAPTSEELLVLNQTRWTNQHVAIALRRAAAEILGSKADQVVPLIEAAGDDPAALRAACARARQITKVFVGPEATRTLAKRMDALLARLS